MNSTGRGAQTEMTVFWVGNDECLSESIVLPSKMSWLTAKKVESDPMYHGNELKPLLFIYDPQLPPHPITHAFIFTLKNKDDSKGRLQAWQQLCEAVCRDGGALS